MYNQGSPIKFSRSQSLLGQQVTHPSLFSILKSSILILAQLRLPNGQTLEETFGENDTLSSVAHYVQSESGMKQFLLSVPMPRRIFAADELASTTLKAAGLAPRGMLIVQGSVATDMKVDTTPIVSRGTI